MPRHYDRAPILEALIDLRAALPDSVESKVFQTFATSLKDQFPTTKHMTAVRMSFAQQDAHAEGQFSTGQEKVGVRLDSANGRRVLQVQRMGFTYSHLAPYSNWDDFRDEGKTWWSRYVECTGVARVTRMAVRVINKIALPGTFADLPKYSNLLIQLPPAIAVTPDTFFSQFQLNGGRWVEGCRVVVNTGTAPRPDGQIEFLLDFDLFVESEKDSASPEIWATLNKLSDAKDELFESCITDSIRELIK